MANKKEQAFIKKYGRKPATDSEVQRVYGGSGDPEPAKKPRKKGK
jgi:hypothetical protein